MALPAAAPFIHMTAWGESDVDGDTVRKCVYLFKATLDSDGAPAAPAGAQAGCTAAAVAFAAPWGQVQDQNDKVF